MNAQPNVPLERETITSQYEAIADAVCSRLAKNERVRRNLPGGGRLRIDRQLPFLILYRGTGNRKDAGTQELITTEAAYLFASKEPEHHEGLSKLCTAISVAMQENFGIFLLLEIAATANNAKTSARGLGFEIHSPDKEIIPTTIDVLVESLSSITIGRRSTKVIVFEDQIRHAPSLRRLDLTCDQKGKAGCCTLQLSVTPIYRDSVTGTVFPMLLQWLRWKLATAIRKAIAEFIGYESKETRTHYDTLGPSSLVRSARLIDQQLCEVSESFDFLLQLTPTNFAEARKGFKESGYRRLPPLVYRDLPYHPNLLKRRLFAIEIERIEDPTLAHLFWEKQADLDRKLTALRDLDLFDSTMAKQQHLTPLRLNSLQLYGGDDRELVQLAKEILKKFPCRKRKEFNRTEAKPSWVNAREMIGLAQREIEYYRSQMKEFNATVELSDSIASGVMVSKHRLIIASDLVLSQKRAAPLLHHEVGTHLLTYFNGRCQPFRQLYAGLAGYEELQEGLAVLGEYLVGGLTRKRLRTLASRVMAVYWMNHGKAFASVFSKLHQEYGIPKRDSFKTTLRVFRGGGFTKDAIYLRGLRDLLSYLASGHDIEPLYVGKIGLHHVPYIQELRRRGVILPPRILPRFLKDPLVRERLEACRGISLLDLID